MGRREYLELQVAMHIKKKKSRKKSNTGKGEKQRQRKKVRATYGSLPLLYLVQDLLWTSLDKDRIVFSHPKQKTSGGENGLDSLRSYSKTTAPFQFQP